ncbi:hypothetical protein HN031_12885 [Nocardioides sp. zg-1308]|uniref:hypothetical protein n=1 Tax=Nocardioides sp. zg-1308 TaxID=2736253 RepID=UPI00155243DA|nr:hypothetical protein [Nocardioides sp. zg-1308]NPD05581.1 hypothetical protein [Nocardioides sp. zg-1308]
MARRAFLHVGTAKSGTTYLHDLWWQHRETLRHRGLLLPGAVMRDHFVAAAVVKGMDALVSRLDEEQLRTWDRLLERSGEWSDDVLISHEHFSDSPPEAAAGALDRLAAVADEVHLVLTVRDLGRVLPSAWQQRVKQGARQPFGRFLGSARRGDGEQKFWRYQDVPAILDRWTVGLPDERVHLVTVPPSGAPRDELWRRAGTVLGVEVTDLDTVPRLPNDSIGIVEAELLRRVNDRFPRERRSLDVTRYRKGAFTRDVLAGSAPAEPFVLPAKHHDWVRERAEAMVATLGERSYDVVGDLDDLLPAAPRAGRTPDEADDAELLDAATVVLDRLGVAPPEALDDALELIAAELLARTVPDPEPSRS